MKNTTLKENKMKNTTLKEIIKEEIFNILKEEEEEIANTLMNTRSFVRV